MKKIRVSTKILVLVMVVAVLGTIVVYEQTVKKYHQPPLNTIKNISSVTNINLS